VPTTGPPGFERTVAFASGEAPAHGRRAQEARGGRAETKGGDDASAGEARLEEAPPDPRAARAGHCGDEAPGGGAE
jgi:hypothetical protein